MHAVVLHLGVAIWPWQDMLQASSQASHGTVGTLEHSWNAPLIVMLSGNLQHDDLS